MFMDLIAIIEMIVIMTIARIIAGVIVINSVVITSRSRDSVIETNVGFEAE